MHECAVCCVSACVCDVIPVALLRGRLLSAACFSLQSVCVWLGALVVHLQRRGSKLCLYVHIPLSVPSAVCWLCVWARAVCELGRLCSLRAAIQQARGYIAVSHLLPSVCCLCVCVHETPSMQCGFGSSLYTADWRTRIVVLWEVCALVWALYCVGVEAVLS